MTLSALKDQIASRFQEAPFIVIDNGGTLNVRGISFSEDIVHVSSVEGIEDGDYAGTKCRIDLVDANGITEAGNIFFKPAPKPASPTQSVSIEYSESENTCRLTMTDDKITKENRMAQITPSFREMLNAVLLGNGELYDVYKIGFGIDLYCTSSIKTINVYAYDETIGRTSVSVGTTYETKDKYKILERELWIDRNFNVNELENDYMRITAEYDSSKPLPQNIDILFKTFYVTFTYIPNNK